MKVKLKSSKLVQIKLANMPSSIVTKPPKLVSSVLAVPTW